MIDKQTITKIADLIEQKDDFKATENLRDKDTEEFIFSYNVVAKEENKLIILCEFYDSTSNEREFLIYDLIKGTLRTATEEEDDKYREIDDNSPYLEQDNTTFIICKNADNTTTRGDKETTEEKINNIMEDITEDSNLCICRDALDYYFKEHLSTNLKNDNNIDTTKTFKFEIDERRNGNLNLIETESHKVIMEFNNNEEDF